MPNYNDFDLDIQNTKSVSMPNLKVSLRCMSDDPRCGTPNPATLNYKCDQILSDYCKTMWCTEDGCTTKPTTDLPL